MKGTIRSVKVTYIGGPLDGLVCRHKLAVDAHARLAHAASKRYRPTNLVHVWQSWGPLLDEREIDVHYAGITEEVS